MSRADAVVDSAAQLPASPSIGGAVRAALSDFFYNSLRLVGANIVWGVTFLGVLFLTVSWLPGLVSAIVLGLPVVGLHTIAALIHREQPAGFSDFTAGIRRQAGPALITATIAVVLGIVFATNVFLGLDMGGVVGWTLSALALYGVVGLAMFLVAAWPIIADPLRADEPLRARLKLAALVNLARPARMFALTALIIVLLVVSTVLFAALITISVAFTSLVATHFVLPAADRLEGRRTRFVPD